MIYTIIFLILAAIAIIMALSAISSKNLVHSSIFLFMLMLVFSSIFIFLGLSFFGIFISFTVATIFITLYIIRINPHKPG